MKTKWERWCLDNVYLPGQMRQSMRGVNDVCLLVAAKVVPNARPWKQQPEERKEKKWLVLTQDGLEHVWEYLLGDYHV